MSPSKRLEDRRPLIVVQCTRSLFAYSILLNLKPSGRTTTETVRAAEAEAKEVEKERTTEKRDLDDKLDPHYRESYLDLIAAPTSLTSLEREFHTGEGGRGDRGSLGAGRGVVMLTGTGPGFASGRIVTAYAFSRSGVCCLPTLLSDQSYFLNLGLGDALLSGQGLERLRQRKILYVRKREVEKSRLLHS